ncbi:anti-phage protein KwaB [Neptunomonas phycophila]|uniref:anti-phage protein KwaB n=1 Tax=Neptunomonas phycophila TaxID=1572645 RepID=UPI0035123F8A
MNKEELNTNLNHFIDNSADIGITVYVVMKEQEKPKKLDIKQEDLPALKNIFLDQLKNEIVKDDELSVLKLSSSDERKKVLYEYDIEIPSEMASLNDVNTSDGHELFNFQNDKVDDVTALLIEIGNDESQVVLYKTMARVNIYGRTSFFLKKSNQRFEKIDEDFFRISSNFQLLQISGNLIVVDLNTIEKFFGFHEVIKKEAEAGIKAVEEIQLLENPETLKKLVDDMPFARKLTKIAKASPVLKAKVPNSKIIEFCKTFPNLKGKIRFNSDESKIQLDTKKSKDLFVKILMDDLLTSELTNYHYTSLAKDGVDESEA